MRRVCLGICLSVCLPLVGLPVIGCGGPPSAEPEASVAEPAARPGVNPLTQPVQVLSDFKKDSVYTLQIQPAVELFRASEGRYPRDLAEFQERILAANRIQLPSLPAGQTYAYDPQSGQLDVVADAGSPAGEATP